MATPCPECNRLRYKIDEAASSSARTAAIWKDIPAPESDGVLVLLTLNQQVESLAIEEYVKHIGDIHGRYLKL